MKSTIVTMLAGIGLFLLVMIFLIGGSMMYFTRSISKSISGVNFKEFDKSINSSANIGLVDIEGIILDSTKVMRRLKALEKSEKIKAIVVNINSPGGAVAPSQRIYEELLKIREKKVVIASMETLAASGGYYISAAAQKTFAYAGTLTGSIGVIMEFANLSRLYDWAKVEPYVIKSGRFLKCGSPYRKMSTEENAYLTSMIESVKNQFVHDIARGRKMDKNKILEIADGRILTGEQAKELGLIDEIGTQSDAIEFAAKEAGIDVNSIELDDGIDPRKEFLEEFLGSIKNVVLNVARAPSQIMLMGDF